MAETTDLALVFFSAVLSGATIALAYFTYKLVKVTKQINEEANARAIEPFLAFQTFQPLSDSGNKFSRFSVKNIGSGHAGHPQITANVRNGRQLEVKPHSETNIVEKDALFYWDVYGVKVGEIVEINLVYTDVRGRLFRNYLSFQTT